ncbi:MAG: cation transporter [Paracoccaceae bacterium]
MTAIDPTLRRTIVIVALLNFGYFWVEAITALSIGSASLIADSVDFLEDTAVNLLILVALGWTAVMRARVGMVLAGIMLIPAAAFLWMLVTKLIHPVPPEAVPLSLVGAGALAVNLTCALLLARLRTRSGSLTRAAFLSSRNDAAANIGIILAGVVTLFTPSIWPDIIVGLAIAALNLDAAHDVWKAARAEGRDAEDHA